MIINKTFHVFGVFCVSTNLTIFITLENTYTKFPSIILLGHTMSYSLLTLILTLIVISFLFCITLLIRKFSSAFKWNMFCKCFWFISSFYHIANFQFYIFYFSGQTNSTNGSSTLLHLPLQLPRLIING